MGILLYVDGILRDGGKETYQVDFTDFFPGERNIIAEVIDQDYQHAYYEITVIVTNPRTFPAPYQTSFNTPAEVGGWQQNSFSGENYWRTANDGAGGQLYS